MTWHPNSVLCRSSSSVLPVVLTRLPTGRCLSVPVPCPQCRLTSSLGSQPFEGGSHDSLFTCVIFTSPELCTQDPRHLGSFDKCLLSIYWVPGAELEAVGTMKSTVDSVLLTLQFVEQNPFCIICQHFQQNENETRPRKLLTSYIKKEVKKAPLYVLCYIHLVTDLCESKHDEECPRVSLLFTVLTTTPLYLQFPIISSLCTELWGLRCLHLKSQLI